MIDPRSTDLFTVGHTPESSIETAVLDCASIRRSRWFGRVVPNVVADDRYLPLYASGENRATEATVLDLQDGECRRLAPSRSGGASPAVDQETGEVFVATEGSITAFEPDGSARRTVGTIGRDERMASDGRDERDGISVSAGLSRSADGGKIGLGFADDGSYRIGALDAPTGDVAVWHERSRRFATVRFSPTDPSLLLFALDADPEAPNPSAGEAWLAREGLGARPLDGLLPDRHHGHWWDPDGTGLWYVAPGSGVEYLDLELGRRDVVWSATVGRAHATGDGRLVAATTGGEQPSVAVYDRTADASVEVAPVADPSERGRAQPQFVGDDEYLAHAIVDGESAVALTPVAAIRERL